MPNIRAIQYSFAGGEISPDMFGRVDLEKTQNAVAGMRNFIALPHGPAANRPGLQFVAEVKASANFTRLIQFAFSATQTFAIEMGAYYFRFHTQGSPLLCGSLPAYNGGIPYAVGDTVYYSGYNYYCIAATTAGILPSNPVYWYAMPYSANPALGVYEIPHAYQQGHLAGIRYVQSGDVVTLVHPVYPPQELKRYGNLRWILSAISFASSMAAPTGVSAVATYPNPGTAKSFQYVITALNSLGYEESPASSPSPAISNDLTITGNFNTITWGTVAGAVRFNVYKAAGGTYGFIGQTTGTSFVDNNIVADLARTIPLTDAVFSGVGNYPSTVTYHEQRRLFAGTYNQPMNVWGTQPGSGNNMSYTIPSQAGDALRFGIAGLRSNIIQHLIPAQDLLALTASTEWRISSSGGALTASTVQIKAQSQHGASGVQPLVVGNYVIYPQAQGGHLREMAYQWQMQGYQSDDLCLLATHLFNFNTITDITFSRAPVPIVWAVNNAGALLGLTYVPEQQVSGWHRHDTVNGLFESCVTVTENNADVLYVIVNRTINGQARRYVECLHTRLFTQPQDAFFVDCGATYNNPAYAPANNPFSISGLWWLEGQTVSILADGAVMARQTVSNGAVSLPYAVAVAQIGLPITADLVTRPFSTQQDITQAQSRVKSINEVWVRCYNSTAFWAGPDANNLAQMPGRGGELPNNPPAWFTDERQVVVPGAWSQSGQLMIRHADPTPLTVCDLAVEAAIGG